MRQREVGDVAGIGLRGKNGSKNWVGGCLAGSVERVTLALAVVNSSLMLGAEIT